MKIKIEFDLENAAFKDFPLMEVDAVMKQAKKKVFNSMDGGDFKAFEGILMDTNGNTIGSVLVTKDEV